jgi:broad specificity phosphatase PhoE
MRTVTFGNPKLDPRDTRGGGRLLCVHANHHQKLLLLLACSSCCLCCCSNLVYTALSIPLVVGTNLPPCRMPPLLPDGLSNQFVALRHGQSQANLQRLIASSPAVATTRYGLTDLGRQQARKAGKDLVQVYQQGSHKGVAILASDLLRAQETAECVREALQEADVKVYESKVITEARLRERFFGEWDETSDENYHNVWKDDAEDASHTNKGVESVNATLERTTACICEWDGKLDGYLIVCVAHGDVLQILQTGFARMDPRLHRSLEHLETATVRLLQLK